MIACLVESKTPLSQPRKNMANMALISCYYDLDGESHMKWIAKETAEGIAHLKSVPKALRGVMLVWLAEYQTAAKRRGDGTYTPAPDWKKPLDAAPPAQQVEHVAARLRAEKITKLRLVYLDNENNTMDLNGRIRVDDHAYRAGYLERVTRPLAKMTQARVNWNFTRTHPDLPAQGWWGPTPQGTIDGTSCPEAYCTPQGMREYHPEAMWEALCRTITLVRSCLMCGPCVPWLPAHWVNQPRAARWLTEQMIMHSALAGVTTFGWARYMSEDENALMEETISETMTRADKYMKLWRPKRKYTPAAVHPAADVIRTRGFITRREDFLASIV